MPTYDYVCTACGTRVEVAIRVNPDVEAGGHAKISTGKAENKFGVSFSEAERLYAKAMNLAGVRPVGVACHIGSQITDLAPMEAAFAKMRGLVERLRGEGLEVQRLDLGGGLGVPYFNQPDPPSPADYAGMIARATRGVRNRSRSEASSMALIRAETTPCVVPRAVPAGGDLGGYVGFVKPANADGFDRRVGAVLSTRPDEYPIQAR